MANKAIILTGDQIARARLLTLRSGLSLEIKGMHRHGKSCYAIIKEEYGIKGSKQKVFDLLTGAMQRAGILA